uniref:Uncharacterized protein n=1 Tax=Magallana gigas TaxID=29159 RepID=K1PSD2_MAGGI
MNRGSSRDEKDSPVTIAALHECSVCHEQFKTKRGFGQHIRHILFWPTDGASRQRKLASSVNEQPEPALKSLPRQTPWYRAMSFGLTKRLAFSSH